MHRFFIDPNQINGLQVTFPQDIAHQITHVLRLRVGDQVGVLDNSGMLSHVRLQADTPDGTLTGIIYETKAVSTEPPTQIALYFGLSSREKIEWILQKGTEIGVSAFCPFVSSRTLVTSDSLSSKKLARWERIIQEAAEQSGRGKLPVLYPPDHLVDCFLGAGRLHRLSLMAWEEEPGEVKILAEVLKGYAGDSIALFVGPEGGFSGDEANQAVQAGVQVVSLGARILRMETAAIVFPALVLYQLGNL